MSVSNLIGNQVSLPLHAPEIYNKKITFTTGEEFKIDQVDAITKQYVRTPLSINSAGAVSIPNPAFPTGGETNVFRCISSSNQFVYNPGTTNMSFIPFQNLIVQDNLNQPYTVWDSANPTYITIPKTGLYRISFFFYIWYSGITFVNLYEIGNSQNAPCFSVFSRFGNDPDCSCSTNIVYQMTAGQKFAFYFGNSNTIIRLNISMSLIS